MTASTLRRIPPVRRRVSCCDSCCHSRCNTASNWQEAPESVYDDLTCPKYARWDSNPGSWLAKEQKTRLRFGGRRLLLLNDEAWALSSIYTGIVASALLSKYGKTTGCKTSLLYWSPVRLPCMVIIYSLQSWEIHPKPLLSFHRKGQLTGCSLGNRLYICVSKLSSGRRLHEAETGSRLTNGSCAMSFNSNHVVLHTMPNVIAYVGLPTMDV